MKIKNLHIKNSNVRTISAGIVETGLRMYLDAGNASSYPGSGITWTDTVDGKEFTLYNGPTYHAEKGGYLNFVASAGQYAEATSFSDSLSNWTLEVWHYYDGTHNSGGGGNSPCLVTDNYGGGTINFTLGNCSDSWPNLQTGHWDGSNWYPTPQGITLTAGNWYHLVGTFDGSSHKLYINGQLAGSSEAPSPAYRSGVGIRLMCRWDYANLWGGGLAVVRIYDQDIGKYGVTKNYVSEYKRFFVRPAPTGLTSSDPGISAYQIKQDYPNSADGLYWIQNDNINSGNPVQVYCDMTTQGGGWTLILQNNYADWGYSETLLRNQTSAPATLVANGTYGGDGSANYSILAWADSIKRSASGFDFMIEIGSRGGIGGVWTANEAYSFVDQGNGGTNWGTDPVSGSDGFHQNITELHKFGSWSYNDSGMEHRMPWYNPGTVGIPGVLTTTHNDGGAWWGTLVQYYGSGFAPSPWDQYVAYQSTVVWYWVR